MRRYIAAFIVCSAAVVGTLTCHAQEDNEHSGMFATVRPSLSEGPFTLQSVNDPPVEKWLHGLMDKPCPQIEVQPEEKLSDVLAKLAEELNLQRRATPQNSSADFRVVFDPDRGYLGLVGIDSLDEIRIQELTTEGRTLRQVLQEITERTQDDTISPEALDFVIMHGLIIVLPQVAAKSNRAAYTRGYRVGDLSEAITAANERNEGDGEHVRDLTSFLKEATADELKWAGDEEAGAMYMVGRTLVVKQTPHGHARIVELLNMLAVSEANRTLPAASKKRR